MPVINEGTQTTIHTVTNAGTQIQVVKLDIGAGTVISDFGGTILTINNLNQGTVRISVGTIATGTLQNLVSGTVNALASGTITGGTLNNLVSGTVNALASGTVTAGTLTNLVSGTINAFASGTITGGTLQNLVSGTINALANGTIGAYIGASAGTGGSYMATTTSGTLLAANTSRRFAFISNDGTTPVYLNFATVGTAANGYRLNANGGGIEITGPSLYTGVITAITSAGSANVTRIEG